MCPYPMPSSSVVLWVSRGDASPCEVPLAAGVVLSASGVRPAAAAEETAGETAPSVPRAPAPRVSSACETIATIPPRETTIVPSFGVAPAAVIVPEGAPFAIRRNDGRLRAGLHALSHADRLDVPGFTVWVSAEGAPEETTYDPGRHGKDVFCSRTKARLRAGEPIVICPGISAVSCGAVYRKPAWETGLRCHLCGFDPSRPRWRPQPRAKERSLDDLRRDLHLAPR